MKRLPATIAGLGSVLCTIAVASGSHLPEALTVVAVGVGVNIMSDLIMRSMRGEDIPQTELEQKTIEAISDSNIVEHWQDSQFQQAYYQLLEQFDPSTQGIVEQMARRINQAAYLDEMQVAMLRADVYSMGTIDPTVMTDQGRIRAFIDGYSSMFVGRTAEMADLDEWLNQSRQPIGLLVALAGRGKSALLANWVSRVEQEEKVAVVYHPISQRYGTNRLRDVLESLAVQARRKKGTSTSNLIPDERSLGNELLRELRDDWNHEKPLLVVIDGLDELDVASERSLVLPPKLGANIHLLVSAREDLADGARGWCTRYDWSPGLVRVFGLGRLNEKNVLSLVAQQIPKIEDSAAALLAQQIFSASENGSASSVRLWLFEALTLLRRPIINGQVGVDDIQTLHLERRQPGTRGYVADVLEQFGRVGIDVSSLLQALCIAHGPLMEDDLKALGVDVRNLLPHQVRQVSRKLVVGDGIRIGYSFADTEIGRAYAESHVSNEQQREWILRYRKYGEQVLAQLQDGLLESQSAPEHVLQYFISYLLDARAPVRRESILELVNSAWMNAHYKVTGSYEGFLGDVGRAWNIADEIGGEDLKYEPLISTLALQIKCMLSFASVTSLASELPAVLPALFARDGIWPLRGALAYANRIPDVLQRAETQLSFLNIPEVKSKLAEVDERVLCAAVLEGVGQLTENENSETRAQLLLRIAPHLTELNDIEQAINLASGLYKNLPRLDSLAALLPQTTDHDARLHITNLIVDTWLGLKLDHEFTEHATDLFKLIAASISIDQLEEVWTSRMATAEAKYGQSDRYNKLNVFLDFMAWHIPPATAKAFADFLLRTGPPARNALRISRFATRLDDNSAEAVALRLYAALEADPTQSFSHIGSYPLYFRGMIDGCGFAIVALAWDRTESASGRRIVEIAKRYLETFGGQDTPIIGNDISLFLEIAQGSLSDSTAAEMVRNRRFLTGLLGADSGYLPIYLEEAVQFLEPSTADAVMQSSRLQKGWGVTQSPYLLPLIAAKLDASQLATIYEYGAGRYEYVSASYVNAAAANVSRMPAEARVDTLLWAFSLYSAPDWLFGSIGPHLQIDDLADEQVRERFVTKFFRIGPYVSPDVANYAFRDALRQDQDQISLENLLILVQYHLDQAERIPILRRLEAELLAIGDSGQQLSLLESLSTAGDRWVRSNLQESLSSTEKLTLGGVRSSWNLLNRRKFHAPWKERPYNRRYVRIERHNEDFWDSLRSLVESINGMESLDARQATLRQVYGQLGYIVGQITNEEYTDYADHAERIWENLDPAMIGEAVDMLDSRKLLEGIESHDFVRAIIPPVALFRRDLLQRLEQHIKSPYSQLAARQYSLVALFSEETDRLRYLEKSVAAFPNAEMPEHVIPWILAEHAERISDDLVPHLLRWIRLYPCLKPLVVLAPKIRWTDEYFQLAFDTICRIPSSVAEFLCAVASQLDSEWISRFINLLIERDNAREQRDCYRCLLDRWLSMEQTDMYTVWRDVNHHLAGQRRDSALTHLSWYAPVILKLGGRQALVDAGKGVVDQSEWWPMVWEPPKPYWEKVL